MISESITIKILNSSHSGRISIFSKIIENIPKFDIIAEIFGNFPRQLHIYVNLLNTAVTVVLVIICRVNLTDLLKNL